jgi:hypothetical protein
MKIPVLSCALMLLAGTTVAAADVCNKPLEDAASTFATQKAKFDGDISKKKSTFDAETKETEKKVKDKGADINFKVDVTWARTDFVIGVPQVTMKNQEFSLDLPQTKLVDKRISFDMPGICMVRKKTGQYPQTVCTGGSFQCNGLDCRWVPPSCTTSWHDIITDVPEPCTTRQEIVMGIPEFSMVPTRFVAAIPEFSMKNQALSLDLPQFKLVNVSVEKQKKYGEEATARGQSFKSEMEGMSREFQTQYRSIYSPAISAAFKCNGDRVRNQREAAIAQVNAGIAQFSTTIQDLLAKGDSQTAQGLQQQLKSLEEQKAKITLQFSQALTNLDLSEKSALAQINNEPAPAGQALVDLEAAMNTAPAMRTDYLRY